MKRAFQLLLMVFFSYSVWQAVVAMIANNEMTDQIREQVGHALLQPRVQLKPSLMQFIQEIDPNFRESDLDLKVRGDEYATVEFKYHRRINYHYYQLPIPFHINMQVVKPKRSAQMDKIIQGFEDGGKAADKRMELQTGE